MSHVAQASLGHYEAESDNELPILLTPLPEYWVYRHISSHVVSVVLGIKLRESYILDKILLQVLNHQDIQIDTPLRTSAE